MFLRRAPLARLGVRTGMARRARVPMVWGTVARSNSNSGSPWQSESSQYNPNLARGGDVYAPPAASSSQGQGYARGGPSSGGGGSYSSYGSGKYSAPAPAQPVPVMDLGPILPRPRHSSKVLEDLRTAAELEHGKTLPRQGQPFYYTWQYINALLNHYAAGWEGEITQQWSDGGTAYVKYKLTLNCEDGKFSQESIGGTKLTDGRGSNADPYMTAEQKAFKRCAGRFGCGLREEK